MLDSFSSRANANSQPLVSSSALVVNDTIEARVSLPARGVAGRSGPTRWPSSLRSARVVRPCASAFSTRASRSRLPGTSAISMRCENESGMPCWGDNGFGKLGDGSWDRRLVPTKVELPGSAGGLALGNDHSCALLISGQVLCWGKNDYGQLGDGTSEFRRTPTPVVGIDRVDRLIAGYEATCAHSGDGRWYCWGDDQTCYSTPDSRVDRHVPVPIAF